MKVSSYFQRIHFIFEQTKRYNPKEVLTLRHIVMMMVSFVSVSIFISCNITNKVNYEYISNTKSDTLTLDKINEIITAIEEVHPNIYADVGKNSIDSAINAVVIRNEGVLLNNADFTLEVRSVLDLLHYADPHLVYYPNIQLRPGDYNPRKYAKRIPRFPFDLFNINDSLIIKTSYAEPLQKGDQILEINGHKAEDFAKYTYSEWRSVGGNIIQMQSQLVYDELFNIKINRKGKEQEVIVKPIPYAKWTGERLYQSKLIHEYKTGYTKILKFSSNTTILKNLKKGIVAAKENGYENYIIDIRGNPGGTGYKLEKILSLLSPKDSLLYMESQIVKVSPRSVNDYDFLKNHKIGELVQLPDSLIIKHIPLQEDLYQGDMNYFVLIDKSTGSTAASFANIIQNNNIGLLVGEPLAHNALMFGDVTKVSKYQNMIVSTMQYNEYTRSKDRQVYPDIYIPYVAKEFIQEHDPILRKTLEYIQHPKENNLMK
ncbi:S41 family peptidase [Flammeovirga sp. SJP92]|uniref:S41 family peptidase n=1 Tax=Flammeovirga sp. SJP92 TaxID=1775430 RepID=UPI0007890972|nr:S41 family peptidase [Flammeovirga sp. SJP92]KXX67592.1 hypothetical protein AVL50_26390 [Flammeovirga sp. SJP92]